MAKTTTFAITHFSVAFGVTYLLTGDLVIGGLVALIEPSINTVAYYFHEKIWQQKQSVTRSGNYVYPWLVKIKKLKGTTRRKVAPFMFIHAYFN